MSLDQQELVSNRSSASDVSPSHETNNEFFGPALPSHLVGKNKERQENEQRIYGPVLPHSFSLSMTCDSGSDSDTLRMPAGDKAGITSGIGGTCYKKGQVQENLNDDLDTKDLEVDKNLERDVVIGPAIPEHLKLPDQDEEEVKEEEPGNFVRSVSDDCFGPSVSLMSTDSTYIPRIIKSESNKEKLNDYKKERESWMLELPEKKPARFDKPKKHFKMRSYAEQDDDRSVWTNTPKDKDKKEKDKKKEKDYRKLLKLKKLEERDKEMKLLIEKAKKKQPDSSLLELHMKKLKEKKKKDKKLEKEEPKARRPFDRNVDLQIHRIDESKKRSILNKARFLNDRFAAGESKFL